MIYTIPKHKISKLPKRKQSERTKLASIKIQTYLFVRDHQFAFKESDTKKEKESLSDLLKLPQIQFRRILELDHHKNLLPLFFDVLNFALFTFYYEQIHDLYESF